LNTIVENQTNGIRLLDALVALIEKLE
jgi:hypothetical protein